LWQESLRPRGISDRLAEIDHHEMIVVAQGLCMANR
jgi:hypothetical protein